MVRRKWARSGKHKQPHQTQYTIANALHPFDEVDEARLCAFLAKCEEARRAETLEGFGLWLGQRGAKAALLMNGVVIEGHGTTIGAAIKHLSEKLIAEAMIDAPEA